MINENYTVDILVNDKPIKQFPHNGKIFVEARRGVEYSIRVKNNTWERILAVSSVDGLDVLNGKSATENGNGYVINGYNSLTIDGFRVSNEKVAKFLFDYKGGSYASSKDDGSERNVGVIGVRIFTEKVKPPPIVVKEEHHHHHHHDHYPSYPKYPWGSPYYNSPTIWGSGDITRGINTLGDTTYGSTVDNSAPGACASGPMMDCCDNSNACSDWNSEPTKYSSDLKGASNTLGFRESARTKCSAQPKKGKLIYEQSLARSLRSNDDTEPVGFDMGTKFGEAKESRVIEVEFEKDFLALTQNIYYASRQSLIEMGVPLGSEKQVSFPEAFKGEKYAKPPMGWQG